jgi:prepilin-type N-terminal cleavage/methylation domain-containing protein
MTTTPLIAGRRKARRGFTLTELMVVTVIVGVMAAMCVPSFQHAIEQSRADIAVANLRAIWAAERLFWLENHQYTSDIATLQSQGTLDNAITASSLGGYTYSIPTAGTATMTATATHSTGDSYSINQFGTVSGTVSIGSYKITPGF